MENVIPNIAIKNRELASTCLNEWIDSENPRKRQSAYGIYSLMLMKYPNDELNLEDIRKRLNHIEKEIHNEENRVRYTMNNFVISAGIYDATLTNQVIELSERIGKVHVLMGKTSCNVPFAPDYIRKVEKMNKIGLKR